MRTTKSNATFACVLSTLAVVATACGGPAVKGNAPRDVTVGGARGAPAGTTKTCEGKPSGDLDPEKAEGLRIVEVCVTGAPADTTEAVRRAMHLRADSKLTAEALRGDLAAAYATGRLDDVEASAKSAGPGSAVLFVTVKERPRVAEVKLEGFDGAGRGAPADAFARQGAPLDIPKLEAAEKKVRETLVEDGWDDAKLTHEITLEREGRVHVLIRLVEGPRAKVGKVTFEGARADLVGGLRKAVELDEGAPFSPDRIERAGLLVSAFYYDRGFLTVKVDTPKKTRAADGATAIAFPIVEGAVFKIGKLVAKGGDAGVEKDVMAKVKTKPGAIFSRSKLVTDLEAIRAMLKERGKPSATVEPETELDPKKGVVDITLRISGT